MSGAQRTAVTVFSGGRGAASISAERLRTPGVGLALVINGYDNGHSTGALRRLLPAMLGPSDFRKNLLLHLADPDPGPEPRARGGDEHDGDTHEGKVGSARAALRHVLRHRFPAGAALSDLDRVIESLATRTGTLAAMAPAPRAAIRADLAAFRQFLDGRPGGFDLAECALGNLIFAGAYLRLGRNFNAAVRSCAAAFATPAALLNVTNGENAFLVALKEDGQLLADEAEIVAPQSSAAISELFLLAEPVDPLLRVQLAGASMPAKRHMLRQRCASVSLGPEARSAIEDCDLLVFGPGTPHSSLLPSYLTPGAGEAIAGSRAAAKVFVANIGEDHDVLGLGPADLVARTLAYLGDPLNTRGSITHVLYHRPPGRRDAATDPVALHLAESGIRWIGADLVDPAHQQVHSGKHTVAALAGILGSASVSTSAGSARLAVAR